MEGYNKQQKGVLTYNNPQKLLERCETTDKQKGTNRKQNKNIGN